MSGLPGSSPEPYVVRRVGAAQLAQVGTVAVLVALMSVDGFSFSPLFVGFVAVLSLVQPWLATERLRVDPEGIRVRPSRVPWSQIREVVVLGGDTLGLRLKPGAPVPRGVRGMIDGGLRLPSLGFTLDRDRLTRAVAAYGGGTPIVDEDAAYSDAGGSFSGSPGSGASSSSSSAGGPSG